MSVARSGAAVVNEAKIKANESERSTDWRAGGAEWWEFAELFAKSWGNGGFNGLGGQAAGASATPGAGNSHPVGTRLTPPPNSNHRHFHRFPSPAAAPKGPAFGRLEKSGRRTSAFGRRPEASRRPSAFGRRPKAARGKSSVSAEKRALFCGIAEFWLKSD